MNNRTIERIRKRFIGITMLAMLLAMFFIGGAIWLSSLFVSRRAIKSSLDALLVSDMVYDEAFQEYYVDAPTLNEAFSSNVRRQADYWVIRYDDKGRFVSINGRFSEKNTEYFLQISDQIKNDPTGYGQRGRLWYESSDTPDGKAIAFIDGTSEINALSRLFLISLIVCVAGLSVTYLLVVHFSDYIVASEVENFSKQNDFITNASHELKTPLAVIRANTEMSRMINGEDEWSESTLKQIDHMSGLIANLVMISKAQELEDKNVMTKIDASSVVENTVNTFESVAKQEGIDIILNIAPGVTLTADASKIMQLVTILVDNAIKYCDEKGSVEVSLSQYRKEAIRFSVSNSYKEGGNVDYNKFFERFYREDKSHNIDKGGYGIGLSIAENICRQYNGDIKAVWKNERISFVCILY